MAQSDLSQKEVDRLMKIKKEVEGTYQIQVVDSRKKPAIQLSVFERIKEARKESKPAFIPLEEDIRIKVLPTKAIEKKGFKGVERIKYVHS